MKIIILGASGVVGRMILKVLEEREIEISYLYLFASFKSKGKRLTYKGREYEIRELNEDNLNDINDAQYCLCALNSSLAKKYLPLIEKKGIITIDNSSAFRNEKDIPLIIPLINFKKIDLSKRKIIANPNCSTIQSLIPLYYINEVNKIKKIVYFTYQAVSGAGKRAIEDLENNTTNYFPYLIRETCIPFIGEVGENNYSSEELKMINETRKIFESDLDVTSFCTRVPINRCHGVGIYLVLENKVNLDMIYASLAREKICILDEPRFNLYPNSLFAKDSDLVYVGRIRRGLFNKNELILYVLADNLRVGASSNAVDILEKLIETKGS